MFLVQCEVLRINHLTLLFVVIMPYACWFLWWADYIEDFKWHLHFQCGVAPLHFERLFWDLYILSRGHRSRSGTNRHFIHVGPFPGIEISSLLYFEGPNRVWRALKTSILNTGSIHPSLVSPTSSDAVLDHSPGPATPARRWNGRSCPPSPSTVEVTEALLRSRLLGLMSAPANPAVTKNGAIGSLYNKRHVH